MDKNTGKFKVTTIVDNKGKLKVRETLDSDVEGSFPKYDCYIDEFKTKEEAQAFMVGSALA